MKLTGPEILRQISLGEIVITPFDPARINPNSYNLTLDDKLVIYDTRFQPLEMARFATQQGYDRQMIQRRPETRALSMFPDGYEPHPELSQWEGILDMKQDNPTYELTIPATGLVLIPNRLYLAQTVEYTETHSFVPCIDGRSSIGRLGIQIHATAGFGDVGFCGTWTLEISVIEPVRIYPFTQICQISYETVKGDIQPYTSTKYQGQRKPRPSGIWKEFQNEPPNPC